MMRIFGYEIRKKSGSISIDTLIARLDAAFRTESGVAVTPDNAMESPTVRAIVTSISSSIASVPLKIFRRETFEKRIRKVEQPNHPLTALFKAPNAFQDSATFWLDAVSWLLRYGNFYALKGQGRTGPIRELTPILPDDMRVELNEASNLIYSSVSNGRVYDSGDVVHARLAARNGYKGDSPIMDVRNAIGFEIAAERMGASVFANGAMPSLLFNYQEGFSEAFSSEEEEQKFIRDFQEKYSKVGRFQSMMVPYGIKADTITVDFEKSQFIGSRQYQRTVIAGAFGFPPHMAGDMSASSFNNVEQQSLNFIIHVVRPIMKILESSLERSLLTADERAGGYIIRFDLDILTRVDFKARQEGLKIKREMGVINANDWREEDDQNPISEGDGGETYWTQGPSGQNMQQGNGQ